MKLLFAPETFNLAETTRMIEVAKACRQVCGETECIFMGYSRKFADLITGAGFEFHLLEPILTDTDVERIMAFDQLKSLKNPFPYSVLKKRVENELALMEWIQPDKIVIGTTVSVLISARVKKIPLIYVKPYAYTRGHIESQEFLKDHPYIGKLLRQLLVTATWLPNSFKKVIKDYQLEKHFRYTIDFINGDINCITTPRILTGNSKLPKNDVYVGPIFANLPQKVPQEINDLVQNSTQPLIYFSMGSSANKKLVYRLLQELSVLDVQVISPMKSYLSPEQYGRLPENIHLYDWLPAADVQALTTIAVTHGGEGTIQTSCVTGKPFIGIGLQPEQSYNIQCCQRYGNAIQVKKHQLYRREFLAKKVQQLLAEPSYFQKAGELQQVLSQIRGPQNVAQIILQKSAFIVKYRML